MILGIECLNFSKHLLSLKISQCLSMDSNVYQCLSTSINVYQRVSQKKLDFRNLNRYKSYSLKDHFYGSTLSKNM